MSSTTFPPGSTVFTFGLDLKAASADGSNSQNLKSPEPKTPIGTPAPSLLAPKLHEVYYLRPAIFLVEGCLFQVPRAFFSTNSTVFEDKFATENKTLEGTSNDNPILLPGIRRIDFEAFLKVLIPLKATPAAVPLTKPEWLSVLALSHLWAFTSIREQAITQLGQLPFDEIEKIVIAHKYDVTEWLFPAYVALVARDKPLSLDETTELGVPFAIKMTHARELVLKNNFQRTLSPTTGRRIASMPNTTSQACKTAIDEIFGNPIIMTT